MGVYRRPKVEAGLRHDGIVIRRKEEFIVNKAVRLHQAHVVRYPEAAVNRIDALNFARE